MPAWPWLESDRCLACPRRRPSPIFSLCPLTEGKSGSLCLPPSLHVMEQGLLPGGDSHKLCGNLLASSLKQATPMGPQPPSAEGVLRGVGRGTGREPAMSSAARGRHLRRQGWSSPLTPGDTWAILTGIGFCPCVSCLLLPEAAGHSTCFQCPVRGPGLCGLGSPWAAGAGDLLRS